MVAESQRVADKSWSTYRAGVIAIEDFARPLRAQISKRLLRDGVWITFDDVRDFVLYDAAAARLRALCDRVAIAAASRGVRFVAGATLDVIATIDSEDEPYPMRTQSRPPSALELVRLPGRMKMAASVVVHGCALLDPVPRPRLPGAMAEPAGDVWPVYDKLYERVGG